MPKRKLDRGEVVEQALEIVDEEGLDELALARVADQLGVQSSALYHHVDGLGGLRQAVATQATENLAAVVRDAAIARSGGAALRAVAHAYRDFARRHPGQYGTTLLPVATSVDSATEPQAFIAEIITRIVASSGIDDDEAVHASRIAWSTIHGFVTLEAADAFTRPTATDESFEHLLDLLVGTLVPPATP